MSNPFLAEVRMFGCNFAPTGWATCDGQLIPIQQNTALFSLIGTFYGGDGRSTFALPNLQDSFAIGVGQGPALSQRVVGEVGGSEQVTLIAPEMPNHTHALQAAASASTGAPAGALMAPPVNGAVAYHLPARTVNMDSSAVGVTGGGLPHENRQPALSLMFCIALQGVFPARG